MKTNYNQRPGTEYHVARHRTYHRIDSFRIARAITRNASRQPRLHIPYTRDYARMSSSDAGPVHGLQRCALASAVACAKLLPKVSTTRMHKIRELVHAIAGLGMRCRSTDTRAPTQRKRGMTYIVSVVWLWPVRGEGMRCDTQKQITSDRGNQERTTRAVYAPRSCLPPSPRR